MFAHISYALAAQSSTNVTLIFIALTLLPGKMIFFLNLRTTNSYLQTRFILTFTTAVYIAFTATIIIVIIITPIYILQLIY